MKYSIIKITNSEITNKFIEITIYSFEKYYLLNVHLHKIMNHESIRTKAKLYINPKNI